LQFLFVFVVSLCARRGFVVFRHDCPVQHFVSIERLIDRRRFVFGGLVRFLCLRW
jgi:hypothetical protein